MPLGEQSTSSTSAIPGTEPRRKRAKIVSACGECRRKKTKCNGETPCRNCEKSGVHCIYPASSSSSLNDDKKNIPNKMALEAIEERLKSIEDMLRAIIKTQNMVSVNEMDPVVNNFLKNNNNSNISRESKSPSPSTSPPPSHTVFYQNSKSSSPKSTTSPIHLPSIRTFSYSNEQQLPPLGLQNYSYDSNNIDKKRKR